MFVTFIITEENVNEHEKSKTHITNKTKLKKSKTQKHIQHTISADSGENKKITYSSPTFFNISSEIETSKKKRHSIEAILNHCC